MNEKVSIIIPAYNASKFIGETLDSVLNQKYNNIEVIVVENHSDDNTFSIVEEYVRNYPKVIKLYKNKSKGPCSARNYGFELSTGAYILYLDADDLISENKLSNQIELLNMNDDPNAISISKWYHFTNCIDNFVVTNFSCYKDYNKSYEILIDLWTNGEMIQTACWLTPRHLIESIDGWNEKLITNPTDDSEFFTRIVLKSSKIIFDNKGIVYYRKPIQLNLSQKKNKDSIKSILDTFISYERILLFNTSEKVKKALATNYLKYIYSYYCDFPEFSKIAEKKFYDLGYKKMWPVGGGNFVLFAKILGFKNSLNFRKLIKKI